jgi:hypothetical protein
VLDFLYFQVLEKSMSVTTPQGRVISLSGLLRDSGCAPGNFIQDPEQRIEWLDLLEGSVLYSRGDELQGRSVLIAVQSQLATIAALMELDGIAQRVVLCPPDLQFEHLPYVNSDRPGNGATG